MARYTVLVEWRKQKEVNVIASDEDEAEERAIELVESWGIDNPEVVDVSEYEN